MLLDCRFSFCYYMGKSFYKYTSSKFIESILKDGGRLKLSSPSTFNDPNDCYFGISEENLKKSYRMLQNVAFLLEFKNDPFYQKSKIFMATYNATKRATQLYSVYDENPGINMLVKTYLKSRKELSNFFEAYKIGFDDTFKNIIDKLRSQTLVGCLTKDNLNTLMWAHYADKHQGICVEYECADDEDNLFEVKYTDDQNSFDLYTALRYVIPVKYFDVEEANDKDPACLKACYEPFIRKVTDWSYEKEVRMVFNSIKSKKIILENGIWFYPNVKVKSVYLGCKMSTLEVNRIKDICQRNCIPVHHVEIKQGNNKLLIKD